MRRGPPGTRPWQRSPIAAWFAFAYRFRPMAIQMSVVASNGARVLRRSGRGAYSNAFRLDRSGAQFLAPAGAKIVVPSHAGCCKYRGQTYFAPCLFQLIHTAATACFPHYSMPYHAAHGRWKRALNLKRRSIGVQSYCQPLGRLVSLPLLP